MVAGERDPPQQFVILPPLARVVVQGTGFVVQRHESESSQNVERFLADAVSEHVTEHLGCEVVPIGTISSDEATLVNEHILVFRTLVENALHFHESESVRDKDLFLHESKIWDDPRPTGAFKRKIEHFDQTVGPGLAFLERTGAQAGVLVFGLDSRAIHTDTAITPRLDSRGHFESFPTVHSYFRFRLAIGVVDLRTGELLWVAQADEKNANALSDLFPVHADLRNAEKTRKIVGWLLEHYPGIEEFRAVHELAEIGR